MARPATIFKVWTILLSIVFGVLLFPNIIDRHGFWQNEHNKTPDADTR